jgi:hypothetical protein
MAAARYNFHLSIYSNCDKIVGTEAYLKTKRGSLSQYFLDCVIDRHYPIALCLDSTKTDQEIRVATIESLSNLSAQMAYITNSVKAIRNIDITPDMLSNFGLLPSIQYAPGESTGIVGVASQNENRQSSQELVDYVISDGDHVTPSELATVIADSFNSLDRSVVASSDNSEEQGFSEEDLENMTDEEYTAAMSGVIERPVMKS